MEEAGGALGARRGFPCEGRVGGAEEELPGPSGRGRAARAGRQVCGGGGGGGGESGGEARLAGRLGPG